MKHKVLIESRQVQSNGWVEEGTYWNAYFLNQPQTVRGCPLGRSQVSADAALRDLLFRTNNESGTAFTLADIETALNS